MFEVLNKAAIYQRFGVTKTLEPEWLSQGVDLIRETLINSDSSASFMPAHTKIHFNVRSGIREGFKIFSEHSNQESLLDLVRKKRSELADKIQSLTEQKKQYSDEVLELKNSLKTLNEDLQVAIVSLCAEEEIRLSEHIKEVEKPLSNAQIRLETANDAIIALAETHRAYEYIFKSIDYDMKREFIEAKHKEIIACVADSGLLEKIDFYEAKMMDIGLVYQRPKHLLSDEQIKCIKIAFSE